MSKRQANIGTSVRDHPLLDDEQEETVWVKELSRR